MIEVFEQSDVSTSAADFQADGTAAPGTTGRLADSGHVHPAPSSSNYQIETVAITATTNINGSGDWGFIGTVTVTAPAGYKVVNGGTSLITNGYSYIPSGTMASDGSSWSVPVSINPGLDNYYHNGDPLGLAWATCVAV